MLAAGAIDAGQYDTVLVFGIEKMPRGIIRSSFFEPWREEAGLAATPAYFALRAQRLQRETGVTKEQLAGVVVKNRRHGVHNPDAMFRTETTIDEVLGSRLVCEPLHLFMLCSPNEGAAAVVLRRGADAEPGSVRLDAAVLRSHLPGSVLGEATPMSGVDDASITPPTTLAAQDAFVRAGVTPADLDVVECQDTDAARELLSYEELGLCEHGEQGRLIDDGTTALGGRLPVNPSGGLLSKGEPLGAFVADVHRQRDDLRSLLADIRKTRRIAGYGAPAKGNTLLNFCGIDASMLEFVVDRSPLKHGLLTPGTHIPVEAPERLLASGITDTLLLAWNFADEILRQQQTYRSNGGRFVIPIPTPRVV
jgi:hypothetical protein